MTLRLTSAKAASAATWLVGGKLLARLTDLATLLVLARLLGPAEFGIVALAMTPIYIVEVVTDLPIAQALVRLRRVTRANLDTAFTLSLLRGCGVAVIASLISVPFARFGEDSRLVPLICALSFGSAIRAVGSPAMIVFIRRIDFKRDFFIDLAGRLVTFATAGALAALTRSYWALAVGTLVGPVVSTALSYLFAPHRPRLMIRDWHIFANIMGWHSCTQALAAFNWQSDRLMLGGFASLAEFGRYSVSDNLAATPQQVLIGPLLRAWLPSFANVQAEPERLRQAYKKASTATLMIGAPAYVGLAMLAHPAVLLALGTQWSQAVPLVTWLALSGIMVLPLGPLSSVAICLGRAQFITLQAAVECLVRIPVLILAISQAGVMGAVVARLALSLIMGLSGMIVVKMLLNLPVREQLYTLGRPLAATGIMGLALLPLAHWLEPMPLGPTMVLGTAAAIVTGAFVYAAAILALWLQAGKPTGPETILFHQIQAALDKLRTRKISGLPTSTKSSR